MQFRESSPQVVRGGAGVKAQSFRDSRLDRVKDSRGGAIGVLVCIELDEILSFGLFPGEIRVEGMNMGANPGRGTRHMGGSLETTLGNEYEESLQSRRIVADRPWPSRPSMVANAETESTARLRAALEY